MASRNGPERSALTDRLVSSSLFCFFTAVFTGINQAGAGGLLQFIIIKHFITQSGLKLEESVRGHATETE